jgi:hypothetical protein
MINNFQLFGMITNNILVKIYKLDIINVFSNDFIMTWNKLSPSTSFPNCYLVCKNLILS